jgi:hypothetical protein
MFRRYEFSPAFHFHCCIPPDIYHCDHHSEAFSPAPEKARFHHIYQGKLSDLPGLLYAHGLSDPLFFSHG